MSDGNRITRRRWTPAEDEAVRQFYAQMDAAALGRRLGRTENSVWLRAKTLGLVKRTEVHGPWTMAELGELRRCIATEPVGSIAARLGRTPNAVSLQGRVLGLTSRKALIAAAAVHDYFSEVCKPDQAYILGLLAADGNVVTGMPRIILGQQAKDAHLVGWVRDRLNPASNLSTRPDGFTVLQVTSRQMVADVAPFGIVPTKSRILAWPHQLDDLQRPFLLGYFDGDGCAYVPVDRRRGRYVERPGWTVCSGSEGFLVSLRTYIAEATGVELWRIQHRPGADLWQTGVTGRGAWVLDEWLHQDGLGLARKRFPEHVVAPYRSA